MIVDSLDPVSRVIPLEVGVFEPSISIFIVAGVVSVAGCAPGCVYPSIMTGLVISGSPVVGTIVCGPAPGILKLILSFVFDALASNMACRNDPVPASLAFVTVKVAL